MMKKKAVIVAPTLNEQENIESFLTNIIAQQVRVSDYELEILISDSHSRDKTEQIVRNLQKREKCIHFLDVKEKGLGLGLSKGLDFAVNRMKADVIITMEADLSNDPNKIPDFLAKLSKADLVVGSRYAKGGGIVNWSWWRKFLSLTANTLLRILAFTPNLHEFTNLYRAFKSEVWLELRPRISMHVGWLFVPAFIFEATTMKFKIVEEPFVFYDRFGGKSKMKTLSYTRNLLHYALRFRLKRLWNALSSS